MPPRASHDLHPIPWLSSFWGICTSDQRRSSCCTLSNGKRNTNDFSSMRMVARLENGYRTRWCISHNPEAAFQAQFLYNQEGPNIERHHLGKLSARRFQRPPFWHRHYSNCGDIDNGKSAQGCVTYTPTIVYGGSFTWSTLACNLSMQPKLSLTPPRTHHRF